MFQFTHPGRGATVRSPRRGVRTRRFNSRTPGGVRRSRQCGSRQHGEVSIHAPREGCDAPAEAAAVAPAVSIHAPREGCDTVWTSSSLQPMGFNSRTPGGVRRKPGNHRVCLLGFQFTHPGRGATPSPRRSTTKILGFNSRTPGGVRRGSTRASDCPPSFQFTHPGRGATSSLWLVFGPNSLFQFTHPGRGATHARQSRPKR